MTIPNTFDAFITSDLAKVTAQLTKLEPRYVSLDDLKAASPLDSQHQASFEYARKITEPLTFVHCIRSYYFALAILHGNYPSNTPDVRQITFQELNSRIYLACILHDLGLSTAPESLNHPASSMSFEIHGGIMAYDYLHAAAPSLDKDQIGDIAQSIMIHTLPLTTGTASAVGTLLRLGALFDLLGYDAFGPDSFNIVDRNTVREIEKAFPRGYLGGEAMLGILAKERESKPNCLLSHTSVDFLDARAAALKAIVTD